MHNVGINSLHIDDKRRSEKTLRLLQRKADLVRSHGKMRSIRGVGSEKYPGRV